MSNSNIIISSFIIFSIFSFFCVKEHYQTIMQKEKEKIEKLIKNKREIREYSINFRVTKERVDINGELPKNQKIVNIIYKIEKKFALKELNLNIKYYEDSIKNSDWLNEIIPILKILDILDEYSLDLNSNYLIIKGKVNSKVIKNQIEMKLSSITNLKIFNKLEIKSKRELNLEIQQRIDTILRKNSIEFEKNSFKLNKEAKDTLDLIILNIKKVPNIKIRIEGFFRENEESLGKELSQKRADIVKEYFVKFGIEKDRILAIGRGKNSHSKVEIYIF